MSAAEAPQGPWFAMRTAVSWRTQTGMKVRRPQPQAAAPQGPWFAIRPQSEAIFEGPQPQAAPGCQRIRAMLY